MAAHPLPCPRGREWRSPAAPRNDGLKLEQPGDVGYQNLPIQKQNFRRLAFPIAGVGLKRILRAQAMFERKSRMQRPARISAPEIVPRWRPRNRREAQFRNA